MELLSLSAFFISLELGMQISNNGRKISFTPKVSDLRKQFFEAIDWFTAYNSRKVFNIGGTQG